MTEQEDVNVLQQQKQILIRKFERKDIIQEEYNLKMSEIVKKINELNSQLLDRYKNKMRQSDKEDELRRIKMAEEKVKEKKEKVSKTGVKKGPRKDSYASFILESLQKKSLNNLDKVADYVMEKKPGRDRAKVKIQASNLIKQVKTGKRKGYTWNDEEFQLTLVTA